MTKTDEHFIPYEQIEPLLKVGMRGRELKVALFAKLGLDPNLYMLRFAGSTVLEPFPTALRRGAFVEKGQPASWRDAADEPVQ